MLNNNCESREMAPVLIPTLCRYKHFKECLESLEKCRYSDRTIVYVSLDYPPNEKYVEGWRKIDAYLKAKELNNNFLQLIVFRQPKNLGISGVKSNYSFLREHVSENYSCYISTEDDNTFSYRFLEYMNNCLKSFEKDSTVYAVTGYIQPLNLPKLNSNIVKLHEMSAWGCGMWTSKRLTRNESLEYIDKMLKDSKVKKHFFFNRISIFAGLLYMKKKQIILGDCFNTAYEFYTGKYCVYPMQSLVQNHGWDGSGTHGGKVSGYDTQVCEPPTKEPFVLKLATKEDTCLVEENIVRYWKNNESKLNKIANWLVAVIYILFGKIYLFENFKNIYKKIRKYVQQ